MPSSVPTTGLPTSFVNSDLFWRPIVPSNTITSKPGNGLEADLQHGYDLIANRKHKEAKKQFEAILLTNPREWRAYEGIGDVRMAKGSHSEAIKAYRDALSLNPKNAALSDKLQKAIEIEKERDVENRNKKIGIFLQVLGGAAAGAMQKRN